MRTTGLILTFGSFLVCAFISVRRGDACGLEWQTIEWLYYLPAFLVGVVGVVLLRSSAREAATQSHKVEADLETLHTSLERIRTTIARLSAARGTTDVYDVHKAIDRALVDDLGAFVEARESLIPIYGLQPYAFVMNEFALGERLVNRTWCASADGYADEVWACIDGAALRFDNAAKLLEQYRQQRVTPLPA